MERRLFGLRARFLAAGVLIVITTVAASAWILVVLSRLASVAATTVRDTDETTAATAAVASALEREDDALLVILGGGLRGRPSLVDARGVTDEARDRLRQDSSSSGAHRQIALEVDAAVVAYRKGVDAIVAAPGEQPLEHYHREANPLLRGAVAAVGKARERRFEEARVATAVARDEVTQGRRAVVLISILAIGIAAGVALRLARHVIRPMQQLSKAAQAIRDGDFEARVDAVSGDEIGDVSAAFNDMTRRLGDFHRSNLGEVLRAKRALEATLHALPDAVLLIDADGRVASINPAAEQLFLDSGRSLPTSAGEVACLDAVSSRFEGALLAQRALDRVAFEAALAIPIRGDIRRIMPRVVPLALGKERGGAVVVLSDVTELARLDEMRLELVAVASHELRTPLTTLRMSLLMLREAADHLAPRVRDLVHTALGGVEQLGETVDELLDMTRIEAGRLKLSREALDLGRLVQEVAARFQLRAEELDLRVDVSVDGDAPFPLGDRARLRIVLDNIVDNALKYTPRGGSIALRLSSRADGGTGRAFVEVAVTDSGSGVPSEFRGRVFEKFFRVEHHRPGSEVAPRGSGIGLYLCKEIVELHGGKIRCETPPDGRGTCITFELPVSAPSAV